MKPVYVFDGKPPALKKQQLDARLGKREEATEGLAVAKEAGDTEQVEKYSKRTVKVGQQHNNIAVTCSTTAGRVLQNTLQHQGPNAC